MELTEVVRRRRMVRRYDGRPVDPVVVDRLLAAAVRAPSAGHTQGWAFLVLDTPADVARFWAATTPPEAAEQAPSAWLEGMRTAPLVIVPLSCEAAYHARYAEADKRRTGPAQERWGVPYWHVDAGMAALLVLLTAVDEGLGACFFGVPPGRLDAFRAEFGVPGDHVPVGAVTVGHRAADPGPAGSAARRKRPLEEVVHRGGW